MTAVDTNILVYAHRPEYEWSEKARELVRTLAEGDQLWAIPWPCIHEFLAVVTNTKIHRVPTPTSKALEQVVIWMESPTLRLIGEPVNYWPELCSVALPAKTSGGAFHDARIAAICKAQGVRELWSADRDFTRFPAVRVRNPLINS